MTIKTRFFKIYTTPYQLCSAFSFYNTQYKYRNAPIDRTQLFD